ncbi:MAG: hypothetical protein LQ337_005409 [Flavoplaca oasis]|nr:MAG: hypothetical protein LQ337_005409 [Flavoplaca oasis]
MDARIEERDEAGNLIVTYAGSSLADEKGRSGGRWDVIIYVSGPEAQYTNETSWTVGLIASLFEFHRGPIVIKSSPARSVYPTHRPLE